jgi:acyl-CoA synthetase (AMP-forming)/AMP-acid ligase II
MIDFTLPLLQRGGKVVIGRSGGFEPSQVLRVLAEDRITVVGMVPTMWKRVLAATDEHDLSSLRLIVTGGEAIEPDTLDGLYSLFPESRRREPIWEHRRRPDLGSHAPPAAARQTRVGRAVGVQGRGKIAGDDGREKGSGEGANS